MARRTRPFRRPGLVAWGLGLTLLGGAATLAISLGFDPADAAATTHNVMMLAFGTAQLGLALLALRVFQSLYRRAAVLATRRRR